MGLPAWAAPPDDSGDWSHGDNYSSMEVVWSNQRTGAKVIQTPYTSVLVAVDDDLAAITDDVPGRTHIDLLAEARGQARAALDLAEKNEEELTDHALDIEGWGRTFLRHERRIRRFRNRGLPLAAAGGAVVGYLAVHFLPWR